MDLFAGRADHRGHVRAIDARPGQRCRAPLASARDQRRGLLVAGALVGAGGFFLQAGELAAGVADRIHPPMHIEVVSRVAGKCEAQARLQARVVAFDFGNTYIVTQCGDAVFGKRLADGI